MVILIHFYIVYDRFHATKTELNNCDGDLLTKTPKIGTIMLFAEKVYRSLVQQFCCLSSLSQQLGC